jgi:dTDP-4-dehydrorhamnose 3,5-epimerase
MRFVELGIAGVMLVEPEPVTDERGFFARTFCADTFAQRGLNTAWLQHSVSYNAKLGTLRGLHFQREPHVEIKLVSCAAGAIYDVVVDLRSRSSSYGRWLSVDLDAQSRRALYIPAGCAHGFQTLVDHTEVRYLISARYVPSHAAGVRWDDPDLAIPWPLPNPILSAADRARPSMRTLIVSEA